MDEKFNLQVIQGGDNLSNQKGLKMRYLPILFIPFVFFLCFLSATGDYSIGETIGRMGEGYLYYFGIIALLASAFLIIKIVDSFRALGIWFMVISLMFFSVCSVIYLNHPQNVINNLSMIALAWGGGICLGVIGFGMNMLQRG